MSDFNSSLPVRTQTNGDVVAFIADGSVSSQLLAIDSSGRVTIKLDDGVGNPINSQTLTASQWLQVVDPSNGPAAPGTAAAFSELVGGIYNSSPITLTTGQQSSLQLSAAGHLLVDATVVFPYDTNYGVVGATTLRTAAQIGNATGAADFNFGTVGAQTLRTASELGNATGSVDYNFGAASAQTLRAASLIGNSTGAADFNYGAIGAQSIRTASQIGNATGAASFNAGATGAQTLRVASNLYDSTGTPFSVTNPLPVTLDAASGSPVNDFKHATSIAAAASDNHDYTVTAAKTLYLDQIESSASGKAKMEVEIETGVATGVFNSRFVQFNSTGTPNMSVKLDNPIAVAAGVRVRVVMTNKDLLAQDLYSTISGNEI